MANVSLLDKLIWALENQKEKLWVRILVAKYLNHDSIFSAKDYGNASYVWQGIM